MTAAPATGNDWVRRANDRPIGHVEMRDVTLEIGLGRRMRIRTLRESDGEVARTLFCVMSPLPFRNLNYIAVEHRGRLEPFTIQLYLPFAAGTLRDVPSSRRGEGHLGSDFSYDDFRTWLYEEGHEYALLDHDASAVRVRGSCRDRAHLPRHGSAPFDLTIDRDDAFVRAIDYRSADGANVVRRYEAEDVLAVDGIRIAGKMTMTNLISRHTTTLHLESAWYDRPYDASIFEPAARKHTRELLAAL